MPATPERGTPPSRRLASRLRTLPAHAARLPRPVRYLFRLGRQTWRRWFHDRCSQEAAALAFKTSLGLVPTFAVAFTLLRAAGMLDERSALLEFFASTLFPTDQVHEVQASLVEFADKIGSGVLGPTGLVLLIAVVYLLFHDIESFWARVWAAPSRRSLVRNFAVFYMLATLVPFMVAISLYHTAHYWRGGVVGFLAPTGSTFLALLAANKLLPSVRVRWRNAAVGAALSALLVEAAKIGFARYAMAVLARYHSIYGAFGLVPLVLVWIYVGWLTVLLGAEVAHATQRLDAIEAGDRRRGSDEAWDLCTGTTAARVMVAIARHFSSGGKALPMARIAIELALPEEAVQRVLGRLKERDLAIEADVAGSIPGWLPARPPSGILLADVLAAFRVKGALRRDDALGRLLDDMDHAEDERASVTLDQLL